MFYTIVTFGPWSGRRDKNGNQRVYRTLTGARRAIEKCPNGTMARILECPSFSSARNADISDYNLHGCKAV